MLKSMEIKISTERRSKTWQNKFARGIFRNKSSRRKRKKARSKCLESARRHQERIKRRKLSSNRLMDRNYTNLLMRFSRVNHSGRNGRLSKRLISTKKNLLTRFKRIGGSLLIPTSFIMMTADSLICMFQILQSMGRSKITSRLLISLQGKPRCLKLLMMKVNTKCFI
jgi:hypothetical protein